MNKTTQTAKFLFADWIAAILAWLLFFIYRKYAVNHDVFSNLPEIFGDLKLYLGIVIVPFFWIILYIIVGSYRNVYRKTRVREVTITFISCFIGVLILFFTLLLDDVVVSPKDHYISFLVLFSFQLTFTLLFRLILTTRMVKKIHHKIIGFNTILVGGGNNALELIRQWIASSLHRVINLLVLLLLKNLMNIH